MVIVMELCDQGNLSEALKRGAFRETMKGRYGAQQPALRAIYTTLLEVATALRHLHSLQLVHCDVKPVRGLCFVRWQQF